MIYQVTLVAELKNCYGYYDTLMIQQIQVIRLVENCFSAGALRRIGGFMLRAIGLLPIDHYNTKAKTMNIFNFYKYCSTPAHPITVIFI